MTKRHMTYTPPLAAMLFTALMGACTPAAHVTSQAQMGGVMDESGGYFTKIGGGITIVTELRNINGQTAICGVWAKTQDLHPWVRQTPELQLLPSGSAYVGGKKVLADLTFLKQVAPAANYAGEMGNCALAGLPWQASYANMAPEVRIPHQAAYRDIDEGGGGIEIDFYQSGPRA